MRIRVNRVNRTYYAHPDVPYCRARGEGDSLAEAIGDLIVSHAALCGVEIVDFDDPRDNRPLVAEAATAVETGWRNAPEVMP